MKIVVIDGGIINPVDDEFDTGDLDWNALASEGDELVVYPRTAADASLDEIVSRCQGAEGVLVNKVNFTRAVIAALAPPNGSLRYIGATATGFNNIDVDAAAEYGVVVTNVPNYGGKIVAQTALALMLKLTNRVKHNAKSAIAGLIKDNVVATNVLNSGEGAAQATLALLLELTNRVGYYDQRVKSDTAQWGLDKDKRFWKNPPLELDELTLGLIGFDSTGQQFARMAAAIGMKIKVHTLASPENPQDFPGVEFCSLEEVLSTSDAVSLHCPDTEQTRGIIDTERLALMKPSAYLINMVGGQLIDQQALAEALNNGRLAGVGLDAKEKEPDSALELDGLTLGLVGFGRIGQQFARMAAAIGMKIIVHTRTPPENPEDFPGVEFFSLEDVLIHSDVVSLHCPENDQTRDIINDERLAMMNPSALLINVSRGPLIVEQDLADTLNSGRLAGAGLDVMVKEPPERDNPLLTAPNCKIIPHVGWASGGARMRLFTQSIANFLDWRADTLDPANVRTPMPAMDRARSGARALAAQGALPGDTEPKVL
jgi:glycerate dehydrogenase